MYYWPSPPVSTCLLHKPTEIEAVSGHFPQKSNDDSLPCLLPLSLFYAPSTFYQHIFNDLKNDRKLSFQSYMIWIILWTCPLNSKIDLYPLWWSTCSFASLEENSFHPCRDAKTPLSFGRIVFISQIFSFSCEKLRRIDSGCEYSPQNERQWSNTFNLKS